MHSFRWVHGTPTQSRGNSSTNILQLQQLLEVNGRFLAWIYSSRGQNHPWFINTTTPFVAFRSFYIQSEGGAVESSVDHLTGCFHDLAKPLVTTLLDR
jgi:hypothetical protein